MTKIKQWGKIKLWETSCCGIPMYPQAHKAYSLIKALTETNISQKEPSDQLNLEENQMPEDEKAKAETPEKPEEKVEEKSEPETPEKPEEKAEEPEKKEASVDTQAMTNILAKAISKALSDAETKRGLVSSEENTEKMQESLKQKSLGELALMQGLFKQEGMVGESPVGIQ